jgi:hypothetical protein
VFLFGVYQFSNVPERKFSSVPVCLLAMEQIFSSVPVCVLGMGLFWYIEIFFL